MDLLVGPDVRGGEYRYVYCRHVRQRLSKRQQCFCDPGQVRRELSRQVLLAAFEGESSLWPFFFNKLGALEWSKVVHKHQGWRLVTCSWLHAGVIHLFANMLSLVFVGIRLEQQFGFVRIGIIYLFSGFGGCVLSSLFIQNSISVGASGAPFGLLGAMLSMLLTNWTIYSNKAAALLTLLVIIIVNLGIGILPHVDNFARIGGFLTGFLLGFVLLPRPQFGWLDQRNNPPANVPLKSKYNPYQYVLWLLSVVLLTAGFVVTLLMLFRGESGNDRCHCCHYLNCVPTSKWDCE